MRISEMLESIASWLASPDNEALQLSEYDERCMQIVAKASVEAAAILDKAAAEVEGIEPQSESLITPQSIEQLGELATALDESGDADLKKQASVLDEIILTIAAPVNALRNKKAEDDKRIESLRQKYNDVSERLDEVNKTADQEKEVAKSEYLKDMDIQEMPLKTRTCPDHIGAQISKMPGSDDTWVCSIDHRPYDYRNGFTLMNGKRYPGGSVEAQSDVQNDRFGPAMYDDREGRLNNK